MLLHADCCDGSDEYKGNVNCPNTCWEAGKAVCEKLKKKIATHQDGLVIRKREVEKAKQAFAKDEEELSKLKSEEKILKGLVDKLRGAVPLIHKMAHPSSVIVVLTLIIMILYISQKLRLLCSLNNYNI